MQLANTEFNDDFARELVGKNTMAPLMTIVLDNVGVCFITVLFVCKYQKQCSSQYLHSSLHK